ncbi:MAG TPA: hypothetical protein VH020_14725, partial [Stellaceae bacterium]|nr:hypothetical protein [Stellaceae bacterium]
RVIAESGARPPRAILTGSSEDEVVGRLRKYVEVLQHDADAKLDDVTAPKVARPQLPSGNEVEASRWRGELDVASAA